jgi:hypothetical protein
MRKSAITGLCLIIGLATANAVAEGELFQQLSNQGFCCQPNGDGHLCQVNSINTAKFRYSQPVVILIPKGVRRPEQIITHLHGFRHGNFRDRTTLDLIKNNDLQTKMKEASATNSIIVMPVNGNCSTPSTPTPGKRNGSCDANAVPPSQETFPVYIGRVNGCDTYTRQLAPQFDKFADWLRDKVKPSKPDWIITGHSGAFKPIGRILNDQARSNGSVLPNLKAVALFDATYGGNTFDTSPYKNALKVNPNLKVFSVYRSWPPRDGTIQGSQKMRRDLGLSNDTIFTTEPGEDKRAADHYKLLEVYYSKVLSKINATNNTDLEAKTRQ